MGGGKDQFLAQRPEEAGKVHVGRVIDFLLTGLVYGREGFRNFFIRMRRSRVGARWYAVALLTAPLVSTAVLIPLSLISPVFFLGIFASDAKVSFVLMGIVVALIVGIFEEIGWTGFAVPTLLKLRYGVLRRVMCNELDQQVRQVAQRSAEGVVDPLSAGVCRHLGGQARQQPSQRLGPMALQSEEVLELADDPFYDLTLARGPAPIGLRPRSGGVFLGGGPHRPPVLPHPMPPPL